MDAEAAALNGNDDGDAQRRAPRSDQPTTVDRPGMTSTLRTPVIDQMAVHRSVRHFDTERPVPEGTLATLVAAAQHASTSSNMQIWSVVAIADPEKRKAMRAYCKNQAFIEEAPLFLVFC